MPHMLASILVTKDECFLKSAINYSGHKLYPKGPCSYMGTSLGPKYIPYTYMDPLGYKQKSPARQELPTKGGSRDLDPC